MSGVMKSFVDLLLFTVSTDIFPGDMTMKHMLRFSHCPYFGFFQHIHRESLNHTMHP